MKTESVFACGTNVVSATEAVERGFRWLVRVIPTGAPDCGADGLYRGDVAFMSMADAQDEADWQAALIANSLVQVLP
jgi:hypothetical protein